MVNRKRIDLSKRVGKSINERVIISQAHPFDL